MIPFSPKIALRSVLECLAAFDSVTQSLAVIYLEDIECACVRSDAMLTCA